MVLRPWQRAIVESIYAVDGKGKRHVRTALITMPRKGGKTALAAALALAHLLGPEAEPRGQVYSAAADKNQAAIIFREMEAIINAIPEFADRVNIQRFAKIMEDKETGSVYQALSSDAKTKHGFSASFVVYDELAQAPNRELYDVLTTSTAARAEPLAIVISTQTSDPKHIMSELVDYGQKVLTGEIKDPTFHATIYAAPDDADPWDEAVWHACNPALGDFRSLDEMRTSAEQAKRIPAREAVFRNLYLNQRVDGTARFVSSVDWRACQGVVNPDALAGMPCYGGLDLSATKDLTCLTLYFPHDGSVLCWTWMPAEPSLFERERLDRAPYHQWKQAGCIEVFPGKCVDRMAVARKLAEVCAIYDVQGIAFDRWGMAVLQKLMADDGIVAPLEPCGQGYKDMSPCIEKLEEEILEHRLNHGGNPVLTWCISNVVVSVDPAGNRKFDKARASQRIDCAQALAMAVGLAARQPVKPPSVYKERGFFAL